MHRIAYRILVAASCCALAFLLASCAPVQQVESSGSSASDNRAYMAMLNQQMEDLSQVLSDFQAAVGEQDVVAMKARQADAARIVDEVKSAEAPEKLAQVKEGYVGGLDQMQHSMADYVTLYTDAQNGGLDASSFDERIRQIQEAYDRGMESLKSADEAVEGIAKE